ncbi:MAG: division/cell wall cluster transcriptional repressor MraZ [Thermodesulfobacteriota bacterium]|nr:division/cell wall cluster transcriptional repressor MraZ [Thermodesulfobacteriota bacterium]
MDIYKRLVISGTVECPLDKQGRILIPAELRAKVNINKTISVNGVGNNFEIWDKKRWDEYEKHHRSNFQVLKKNLAQLGIKAL